MPPIPDTMRALVLARCAPDYAGCELTQLPVPQPAHTQALVRIRACALGFPDLLMTRGAYQHKPELPSVMGGEMAGEVVAVGEGAHDIAVGDAVVGGGLFGGQGGGFAEYGAYDADALRPIPAGLDAAHAAATGSAYLTAYVALVRRAALKAGEWVLIHGAAGGVGLAAVDLARHLGARVIATAADADKRAILEAEYRPDAILDPRDGFRATVKELTDGRGADVIYDPVGGDICDESIRCIAWGGRLLIIGFAGGRIADIPSNMPLIKGFSVVGVRAGEYGRRHPEEGRENLEAVWTLAGAGKITPRVHACLPLENWRDAFAEMDTRKVVGRVIIAPEAT